MKFTMFIAAICLLVAIGCSNENNHKKEKSDTKNYTSDSLKFKISYPANWEMKTKGNTVCFLEPYQDSSDRFQENIVAWNEEMPVGISDSLYEKATTAELKIRNQGLEVRELLSKKLGANIFHCFSFSLPGADSSQLHVIGYTLVKEKRGYNFSCSYSAKAKKDYQQIFETILSTLVFQ